MSKEQRESLEQIFYAVSVLAVVFGGIVWLATINDLASANTADIKDLKSLDIDHTRQFEEIRTRLTRIEDAVGAGRKSSGNYPRYKGE
jgi:hypothetical protein